MHLARAVGAVDQLRVVARADGVETERQRLVENRGELDALVAAQARVRGAAGCVLVDEVLYDVIGETLGKIPYIEGNAEHVGRASRVVRVFDRAATAGAQCDATAATSTARGARR